MRPYQPAEDSILLSKALQKLVGEVVLEIGIGSGYTCEELTKNSFVVGTDINPESLKEAQKRLRSNHIENIELVQCDGATPFREECFDLVVFNPPYLPSDVINDSAIDGGKRGIEVLNKFLDHSIRVLSDPGLIVFVLSTLANYKKVLNRLRKKGFKIKKKDSQKLFFEEIFIIESSRVG